MRLAQKNFVVSGYDEIPKHAHAFEPETLV